MSEKRQGGLGDELFGTAMGAMNEHASTDKPDESVAAIGDLDRIQQESEAQALPDQEKQFRVAARVRSKLHNLPDPTRPPLGFVPGKGFDAVFPFIKLPHLAPNLNGDWVQFGSPELEPNRLYYGDNLQVLRTLPSNSIDLIYIDPPFFSGADYNVIWGDTNEVRTFSDIWEGGLDTYLIWLNARLWEMRRVLKDTGSIFVHCDWHASHYIKAEMDKVFGYEKLINEIAWYYTGAGVPTDRFARRHDVIFWYAKGRTWTFNRDSVRTEYAATTKERFSHYIGNVRGDGDYGVQSLNELGKHPDDVLTVSIVAPSANERIGYPTQKPVELIQTLLDAASSPGDLIADFFSGGGTTAAVAQGVRAQKNKTGVRTLIHEPGKARRWIACDSSRVAVSVALNRLVTIGEAMSGVKSNYGKRGQVQGSMDLPSPDARVPDIRVHYVGVYPMDRFTAVDQPTFDDFVLKCLGAQRDASDSAITGWRTAREPLLVGPSDPSVAPDPRQVREFFDACLKQLQPNMKLTARVVCWRTSPELAAYQRQLSDYVRKNLAPRGVGLDLDFLLIDGEELRERIRSAYPDADDNEFLLRFTKEPIVGEVRPTRLGARKYRFEAVDADSTNAGGYLVNCQWDFDYQRGHFAADRDYVLCRSKEGKTFLAELSAEYTFATAGKRTIACRVQDNLGAETVKTLTLEVS